MHFTCGITAFGTRGSSVVGQIITLKGFHVLIPKPYENVTLYSNRKLTHTIYYVNFRLMLT